MKKIICCLAVIVGIVNGIEWLNDIIDKGDDLFDDVVYWWNDDVVDWWKSNKYARFVGNGVGKLLDKTVETAGNLMEVQTDFLKEE